MRFRKVKTWGSVFYSGLARGYDHGYAAHLANQWQKRKLKKEMNKLEYNHKVSGYPFTCPGCGKPAHIGMVNNIGKASGKRKKLGVYHDATGSPFCRPERSDK